MLNFVPMTINLTSKPCIVCTEYCSVNHVLFEKFFNSLQDQKLPSNSITVISYLTSVSCVSLLAGVIRMTNVSILHVFTSRATSNFIKWFSGQRALFLPTGCYRSQVLKEMVEKKKKSVTYYQLNYGIWILKSQRPGMEYSLYHLLVVWLCENYLISICLSFLISNL